LAWDHIGTMLSRCDIVQWIDEETEKLQRARALLTGHTPPLKRGYRTRDSMSPLLLPLRVSVKRRESKDYWQSTARWTTPKE
jgi:hypothetical protein